MKATHCTRHTFNYGSRTLKYNALSRYVCNACGGGMTHRFTNDTDSVACARCGCEDMISERRYLEQISDGYEVRQGLPPALRALLKGDRKCQSATEAIADLFD